MMFVMFILDLGEMDEPRDVTCDCMIIVRIGNWDDR